MRDPFYLNNYPAGDALWLHRNFQSPLVLVPRKNVPLVNSHLCLELADNPGNRAPNA